MSTTAVAAMASSSPVYNSTISAPLASISPTDHGGLILITNAFGLILVLVFLLVRISVRLFISPPFGGDDYFLSLATVSSLFIGLKPLCSRGSLTAFEASCIIYSALVFTEVDKGFGTTLDMISSSDLIPMQKVRHP